MSLNLYLWPVFGGPMPLCLAIQYSISKIGWPHGLGHTVIALHTVIRYTRIFGWIWGKMISGNLPIESGRAQGCFFSGKMAIWDSGSQFWDSGSPPRALGRAQGSLFFVKNSNLGFWKPILGFWKPSESIGACSRQFFFIEKWQSGILEALREHQGVLKDVCFSEKWQSGILEGLHTVIAYPHGY